MNTTSPALPPAEGTPVDSQNPTSNLGAKVQPVVASAATGQMDSLSAHEIERDVLHRLQNHPGLKFARLDVHRCNHDAICLEGFLESNEDDIDLCDVVRGIHGITSVVNRVVAARPAPGVPKKG